MRRSSSTAAPKDNPPITSFMMNNNFHSHEEDAFCYDKLESVHFESQELQNQIEALITRMKNDSNLQNTFRSDQGFFKVKKEDFVSYYNGLREVYKGTKKVCGNWESLFEDFSTRHSQSIAKKNKEFESLIRHYRYKLKALEFEKKSALEEQKNDLLRREQEVLDTVNSFINSLKGTKKSWENNLNELHFCVQEHAQTIDYLVNHKSARLEAFSSEIDALFNDAPLSQRSDNLPHNHDLKATGRQKEYVNNSKQPFSELLNILSPITQEVPKMDIQLSDKSKEDLLTSKRGKDLSNNSYDDLFVFNKGNGHGAMQENSRYSGGKEEGGWDSNLDDEDNESEKVDVEQIEKALELLFQNGLLGSHAVSMYEQIIQSTEESGVDREIQMNLFKDHLRLQLKRYKFEKGYNASLKVTNKRDPQGGDQIKDSPHESAFRRKVIEGPSVSRGPDQSHETKCLKKMIPPRETQKVLNEQTLPISKEGAIKKKNDISLSDLLGVREYSFVLESPLSTHPNIEGHLMSFPQLQHADKEDIMKADSLPITLKEVEFSKIIPDRRELLGNEEDEEQCELIENTKRKEQLELEDKQKWKQYNDNNNNNNNNINNQEIIIASNDPQIANPKKYKSITRAPEKPEASHLGVKRNFLQKHDEKFELVSTLLDKTENGFQKLDPHKNLEAINTEGTNTLSPQRIQSIKGKSFNIDTVDIKLSSIDTYPELINRTSNAQENPLRKLANKTSLKNGHLTDSTNMRVSTKANTGFNDAEIYSTENAQLTMYSSIDQTQQIARIGYQHSFSGIVEMEEDIDEKIPQTYMSNTFPPHKAQNEKDGYKQSPKEHGNNISLREITITDSRCHLKK